MEAHLTEHHPEYAHLGKGDGLPLPQDVYDAVALTTPKESKFGIPPRSPFMKIQQKENVQPVTSARGLKRRSDTCPTPAATLHAKRGCLSN